MSLASRIERIEDIYVAPQPSRKTFDETRFRTVSLSLKHTRLYNTLNNFVKSNFETLRITAASLVYPRSSQCVKCDVCYYDTRQCRPITSGGHLFKSTPWTVIKVVFIRFRSFSFIYLSKDQKRSSGTSNRYIILCKDILLSRVFFFIIITLNETFKYIRVMVSITKCRPRRSF